MKRFVLTKYSSQWEQMLARRCLPLNRNEKTSCRHSLPHQRRAGQVGLAAGPAEMKKLLLILTLTLACLAPLTFTGCGTLDPTGVYLGDKVLYDADVLIATSYDTVHTFVSWEYTNRATLTGLPQIKETADALRVQYPIAHKAALAARSAYLSAKTAPNATALSQALAVLRQAMTTASQYLAQQQGSL